MAKAIMFGNHWEFFPCQINNQSFSIRFDTAAINLDEESKARYPHTIVLQLHANEVDERGFPTPAERERINKVEDNLTSDGCDMRLIGVITGGSCVRFVFCYNGCLEAEAKNIIQTLLGENRHIYKHEYQVLQNDNFSYFFNACAPDLYERNWIMNRNVCANLEKDGESFKTLREIDFFCNFSSENHIQSVAKKLEEQGFRIRSQDKRDNDYSLHFVIEGIPTFTWINDIVANILDLMEDTDGYFDGWGSPIHRS